MARISVRYLATREAADGAIRYYWQPKTELVQAGWRVQRLPDRLDEAVKLAEKLNAELDAWRKGAAVANGPAPVPRVQAGTVADVIRRFKASSRFTPLAAKTQIDYAHHLRAIEDRMGDAPVQSISRRVVQAYYEDLRAPDPEAPSGKPRAPAAANARMRVLRILLGYAHDLGEVETNAASKPRLIGTDARLRVWTVEELHAVIAAADRMGLPSIGTAVLIAHETGQRQGDILRLTRLRYRDGRVKLRQRKRGAHIDVPVTPELRERLDTAITALEAAESKAPTIVVCETTGVPWQSSHFGHKFGEVRAAAIETCPSIADAWFLDLRDTAVTHLAEAGCTIPEIASITGHSEAAIYAILKHYLALNGEIASAAIAKLMSHRAKLAARQEA